MQSYPVTEVSERYREIFENAAKEPILLTEDLQPNYVIMSANDYQQLMQRLAELEDRVFGQLAETALKNSQMVGSQIFTAELNHLASLDSND